MATRREIRRSLGQYRYKGRKLLEAYGTATAGSTTTSELALLAAYPSEADHFDMYGHSVVGGAGVDEDAVITTFLQSSNRLTFTPAGTSITTSSIVEIWQPGLNATLVNDRINQAIDLISDECFQEWGQSSYAFGIDEVPVPREARFLYSLQYADKTPVTGNSIDNVDTFRALFDTSAATQLSQGFQVGSTGLIRGVVLYLRLQGSMATARTLTVNLETNSSGVPSTTEVTGATTTLSTDYVYSIPRLVYFDFGRPIQLTADTTYHITLAISGSADSTNYIAWGEDDDNTYTSGALSRATNAGTTWVAVSGSDMIFHVVPWFETWTPLNDNEWEVYMDTGTSYVRLLYEDGMSLPITDIGSYTEFTEGQPFRLLGLEPADRPSSDTAELEVPRAFVEATALSQIMQSLSPELAEASVFWSRQADRELELHPVRSRLPAGARRVFFTG